MLTIRTAQIEAFKHSARTRFAKTVAADLRKTHPEAVFHLDDATLQAQVLKGIERAGRYGITQQNHAQAFVILRFVIAPTFYRFPPIYAILTDPDTPDDQRLATLVNDITPEQWTEAQTWVPSTQ